MRVVAGCVTEDGEVAKVPMIVTTAAVAHQRGQRGSDTVKRSVSIFFVPVERQVLYPLGFAVGFFLFFFCSDVTTPVGRAENATE